MFSILPIILIITVISLTGYIIYHVKTSPVRKIIEEDNLMTTDQKSSNINRTSPFKTDAEFSQELTEQIPKKIQFNPLEFPDYNNTEIVLLIKNPFWLYTYWNIYENTVEHFESINGKNSWDSSQPVIRVSNHSNNSHYDIEINDYAKNWYLQVNNPNNYYSTALGRKFTCGKFVEIASSNIVLTPAKDISQILDKNWMPINECWNIYKKSNDLYDFSSLELIKKD